VSAGGDAMLQAFDVFLQVHVLLRLGTSAGEGSHVELTEAGGNLEQRC
jgi:hypothetical protein